MKKSRDQRDSFNEPCRESHPALRSAHRVGRVVYRKPCPSDAASKGWVLCADSAAKAGIKSAPCRPTAPCLVIECAATGAAPSGKPRRWRSDPDHTTPACGTCVGSLNGASPLASAPVRFLLSESSEQGQSAKT